MDSIMTRDYGSVSEKSVPSVFLESSDGKNREITEIFTLNYSAQTRCNLLGSPSEMGTMQYDNKVVLPTIINLTGIIKSPEFPLMAKIIKNLKETDEVDKMIWVVHTKSGSYENMVLKQAEEIGESSRYDGIEVRLSFEEYLEHNVSRSEE